MIKNVFAIFARHIVVDALRQLKVHSVKPPFNAPDQIPLEKEMLNFEVVDTGNNFRTPTSALTIHTSPAHSSHSQSTDTASESGSAFNSPNQQVSHQHQPSSADLANSAYVKDFSRLVVVKMSGQPSEQSI